MATAHITAVGTYVPEPILDNEKLEQMVNTSADWIIERTGISERHILPASMATSDMAVHAARRALESRGMAASELDAILVCTVTPDMLFPSTACLVQHQIGASKAWGFDLIAACSGFVYGMTTAAHLVMCGSHKRVLVIGADTMSRVVDYEDRSTCILFGDGAGAFLIEAGGDEPGFIDFRNEVDGSGGVYLNMPAGGSRMPTTHETVSKKLHCVHQSGQNVFKFAVTKMEETCKTLLARHGLTPADVKLLVPHQANRRIITHTAEKLGWPADKIIINIGKYGNTVAATLPLATADALAEGKLRKGDYVMFVTVGAGFTVGGNLWRWAY